MVEWGGGPRQGVDLGTQPYWVIWKEEGKNRGKEERNQREKSDRILVHYYPGLLIMGVP